MAAIFDAGYTPGRDGVAIALDPAASEFHRDGSYTVNGQSLSSDNMIARYGAMVEAFPIWSIEDGLGEEGRDKIEEEPTGALGGRIQGVGDDNFWANPAIVTAGDRGRRGLPTLR